jgi:hypothetical protein
MPRISKQEVAAVIAARPFDPSHAPDAPQAFGNLPESMQRKVAESIARDKAAGLSGADLRARYGGESKSNGADRDTGLTGPMRRTVLRRFALDTAATIARSYDAYGDGTPRTGSAHARNYGARAAERQAEAIREAEAVAAKAEKAAQRREAAKARRDAKAAQKAASTREEGSEAPVASE